MGTHLLPILGSNKMINANWTNYSYHQITNFEQISICFCSKRSLHGSWRQGTNRRDLPLRVFYLFTTNIHTNFAKTQLHRLFFESWETMSRPPFTRIAARWIGREGSLNWFLLWDIVSYGIFWKRKQVVGRRRGRTAPFNTQNTSVELNDRQSWARISEFEIWNFCSVSIDNFVATNNR